MAQNGIFSVVWFFGFLSITPFKTIKLQKLGVFWKIQEICNNMGTRICKIIEEMSELATLKIQSAEIEPFWATPEILLFLRMRFFNFFLNHMVQKYQNEIAPIFYYEISTKINEKDLKIPNLLPPDWKHPYWMTLYIQYIISDQPWNRRLEDFILLSILLVCWEKPRQSGGGVACLRFWGPCQWFGRGVRTLSWLVITSHIWSNF